ncbi:multifunctional CCA tRNA nucleotidyl transferase/2'3'-cyclic phosphodiesterase/2'nucleotidase/phosphatase [Aliidiomarina minuta]|uniref:Multifunctional CCA tRNA nucleotidyl transferase/2'3'-cyclic phosphodiesterase/2'nucleotidase/phosphatase n=1 Tax=Aliidiomarina minuta TaxID=880057 RepID=A0A432W165_9GAMM|nr:multifunctional CCA tRNA nucleotidyl transferase/2'3'-cyclic phosphodiesterase/2'nucleotidase/phosphatase [Aliidiomarina minuta]RUO22970.1 multifunctional CCA tRNA nucleotidyl transferase/2'3'-cyclic phosphodiesterase/2'nucleotidase/phosphatase [Aliidiomarina minuta]
MEVYLVGGAVRDELLGLDVHERDYVVVGATPQQMLDLGYQPVGKDFPVFLHPESRAEYALARTERKSGRGYKGFDCYAAPDVTLEQDLQRRDLTVNAIAKDQQGKLIDPYQGQQDLKNRVLRHVSPAFSEDPLRVLRVARFAARFHQLGFQIAPETEQLMRDMAQSGELEALTKERVWQEFARSLTGPSTHIFFTVLHRLQALKPLLAMKLPDHLIWPGLKKFTQQSGSVLEEAYAVWIWDLYQQLPSPEVQHVHEQLKVPNNCRDLADMVLSISGHLHAAFNAKTLLEVLQKSDAWRRSERFAQAWLVIDALDTLPAERLQLLKQAFKACLAIDVQSIIEAGYKGPEITKVLNQKRLDTIADLLTDYKLSMH